MAHRYAFSAIAILGSVVGAIPTIAFPLNSQVPPVARVSEPFQYTFSSSTFSSALPLKYSLSKAPEWLSLDSNSRTLSGTPTPKDTGPDAVTGVEIEIVAEDDTGSVILNATIVISKEPPPVINIPLSNQLSSFGTTSLPSTALYHPSTPFRISIDRDTFNAKDGTSNFNYYAVTADNTPLPSWITFDLTSFTFSGQTPDYASLIQPPQTFGMKLIASDVAGFAGAAITFDIKVGVHLFAFKNANLTANFSPGIEVKFDGLANNLQIDGQAAAASSVASVTAQCPPWISFDNSTLSLSGTPPSDAIPGNISVQATDIYGDIATAFVLVDIDSTIFTAEIRTLNVTAGSTFSYDLSVYLRNKSDIVMALGIPRSSSWANFDSETFLLSGYPPSDLGPSEDTLFVQGNSKSTQASSSQNFTLSVVPSDENSSTTVALPPESTEPTNGLVTTTRNSKTDSQPKRLSKIAIAGISIAALTALAFIILLSMFFYRRRRQSEDMDQENIPKISISAPLKKESTEIKIVNLAPEVEPPTLHLDTSGFGADNRSSVYSADLSRRSIKSNTDNPLMRSRTYSGVSSTSGARSLTLGRPGTVGGVGSRARAYSENAIPRSDSATNWKATQDSSYPIIHSRANSTQTSSQSSTTRVARTYSNYSRKGHTRRSGRVWASDTPIRNSLISTKSQEATILNLKDDNFAAMPLANFTVMSKGAPIPKVPEVASRNQSPIPARYLRRSSKLISPLDQTMSGIGHGSRESIDSVVGPNQKRKSIGHGQNWTTFHGLPRDSRTWLTIDPNETEVCTRTNSSNTTEATDILQSRSSIHLSPNLAQVSQQRYSRPIGRREIGSTPFFSGRIEATVSRKSPNSQIRAESTLARDLQAAGKIDAPNSTKTIANTAQGSLDMPHMSTRESTRQLRFYVQNHLSRKNTDASVKSTLSKDSRFESASPSMQSVQQLQRDGEGDIQMQDCGDSYEEFLPENCSEGSWETQVEDSQFESQARTYDQSNLPNIITYGAEDTQPMIQYRPNASNKYRRDSSAEVNTATGELVPETMTAPSTLPLMGTAGNARMVRGRGRRPVSVDAGKKGIGSMKGRLESTDSEQDFTAYI